MNSCKNGEVLGNDSFIRQPQFNEPLEVRFKGCGKLIKGRKEKANEKAKEKGRRYNGCGQVGQSIRETVKCFSLGKYVFYLG